MRTAGNATEFSGYDATRTLRVLVVGGVALDVLFLAKLLYRTTWRDEHMTGSKMLNPLSAGQVWTQVSTIGAKMIFKYNK